MNVEQSNVKRVVFTGDFFRPSQDRETPTQHFNIGWLADLVGQQIDIAAALPMDRLFWGIEGLSEGQLNTHAVRAIYAGMGMGGISLGNWARLQSAADLTEPVRHYFDYLFRDALVVGFELPNIIKRYLSGAGIPFVDCLIHPIRFMDDVFLGFSSNHPAIGRALGSYGLSDEAIRVGAGLATAAAGRHFNFQCRGRTALVIGQVASDRTQIRDGGFVGFPHFADRLDALLADFDDVLVKPHPFDVDNVGIRFIEGTNIKARRVHENVYSLMSLATVQDVITLSSSVGMEAPYFGCRTHFLLGEPVQLYCEQKGTPTAAEYVGIYDAFLTPDFWRSVLNPLQGVTVTPPSGFKVMPKPNRLRISLQSFWGFDAIDGGHRAA